MGWRVADHSDYKKNGGQAEWGDGVLPVSLRSWDEFNSEIARLVGLGDFIWRGQRLDWPLICQFDRIFREGDRADALKDHTNNFLRAMRGRRGSNPPALAREKTDEIWALGQHYGLPTPLLDWTESPFVAAFFAFQDSHSRSLLNAVIQPMLKRSDGAPPDEWAIENAPCRFVYGLSKDIIRWGPGKDKESPPDAYFVEFVETLSDENSRLLSQRGLFTKALFPGIPIEATVRRCYADDVTKGVKRIILVKIRIPEIDRAKCLRDLNSMNINSATLFPDLTGAAAYCAMKLEIPNY
jgi:hypothetical protein